MNKRPAQYYLSRIVPSRITAAREYRGFTKVALAEKLNKTASAISQFESGKSGLDLETFVKLIMTLNLPPAFFASNEQHYDPVTANCHFRSKSGLAQGVKKSAKRNVEIVLSVYSALESRGIRFPDVKVDPRHATTIAREIEEIAANVRSQWGLGSGPIQNILNLVESKGILVIILDGCCRDLDAFSSADSARPFIAINYSMPASRLQFDIAHELAHLILHEEETTGDPESERAAHSFAGAFLTPAPVFREEHPARYSYLALKELKQRWHISMQAALYRAKQVGAISDSSFRWGMVDLSKRGQRVAENFEFPKDKPLLLTQALELLIGELTIEDLSDEVNIHPFELVQILKTQLVPQQVINKLLPTRTQRVIPEVVRIPG